jgi:hypothetical protein
VRYVWDPAKDVLNRRKHGLALADGIPALDDGNCVSWIDDRFDYGEERIANLGLNGSRVFYVVTTQRDKDLTRIISVRRAEIHEIALYDLG